ncbi:endonuclease MutS2 [Gemella sp. zg-570]|uniref:endonuclease MutS2 n=1 Tax=Gemella sp. zg-570 TaxID=2840371 RepID=UPI001C0DA2C2|nr:endonuclease MutS2 [Gemella sp. zg-570]QWQ39464.1 endonuclease MutS2 [Gemella sp. zg-570]
MQTSIKKKINLDLILDDAENYCFSDLSVNRFKNIEYVNSFKDLILLHKENEEVEELWIKHKDTFKLKIYDYFESLKKAKKESLLYEKELFYILFNLLTYRRFKNKFEEIKRLDNKEYYHLSNYVSNIANFDFLIDYLNKIIDEDGYIRPTASEELKNIKDNIKKLQLKSDKLLKDIIKSNINKLSEAIVTKRNDRDVILVKPEYKNDFGGIIHDQSASGNTFYVEPKENVIINNEISILKRKEKEEIQKILKEATKEIGIYANDLNISLKNFANIEFIFSKINFSVSKGFIKPLVEDKQKIFLKNTYNPLIPKDEVVKNNVILDNKENSLIITGPNTGGKTVILKTVSLCVALTHLGLYIPADIGSKIGYYENIFIDIGDNQSIENNLSTFSSHMTNIIDILNKVNNKSLVLLDELCSGTDPSEGAVLSMALLNKFKEKEATVLCTTHYPEIKDYCFKSNYYKNSSLEFDFENLKPTYKFIIGLPGKSNAINISYKLGLSQDIVSQASIYLNKTEKENSILIDQLAENIKEYDSKINKINSKLKKVEEIKESLKENLLNFYKYRDSLYEKTYQDLNYEIENRKADILNIYKNFKTKSESIKQHEINEIIDEVNSYKLRTESNKFNKVLEKDTTDIKVGDDVLVIRYNQRASVLAIKDNILNIKLGSLKLSVKRDEVKYIEKELNIREQKFIKNNISNVSLDINVIGKNTEEAIAEIENYIDKVLLIGYDSFSIIHGVGAGILKRNIAEYLKKNRFVYSYRSGNQAEGGLGVTIVEMK